MTGKLCGIFLAVCAMAMAQSGRGVVFPMDPAHQDAIWAEKTGLLVGEVREMRIAAGIPDSAQNVRIDRIDAASLKQRNQILLVEGVCGTLHVLERQMDGFREVWSLTKLPALPGWTGSSRATDSEQTVCLSRAKISVIADSRIVVEVPVVLDPFVRGAPASRFTFAWDGSEYKLVEEVR
jgi:hypothetical protein